MLKMAKSHTPETFVIYRSSAGSGKTYRLAVEYIALCVSDPLLFSKVLAVTFTNKATREMKNRIIEFLIKLSEKEDEALMQAIREMTGLSEEAIAKNAREVIKNILHQYSRFSVSTIDAFFQKIVKSFARELGLLGNFTVELDQDKVMQEVIDRIIAGLEDEKDLTKWMVDFSYQQVDEGKSWNIRPQIKTLAREVLKESFREVIEDLNRTDAQMLRDFLMMIRRIKHSFEKGMKILAESALGFIDALGLSVDDFAYKGSGPAGYFNKILQKNDYKPGKRLLAALEDPDKWAAANAPRAHEIKHLVSSGLQDMAADIVNYYDEFIIDYNTAAVVLKNLHVYGILRKIVDELKTYRHEHDVMLISDIPVFLQKIIAENDAPFIYEKTGSWYRHFLIDEFQDTSQVQWGNFKPLIVNGLSQGYKSLLVGDGKQSIYRWRGGDWSLILHKVGQDLASWQPSVRTLDTNWRSGRKVVEFNNTVFSFVPPLLRDGFLAKIDEAALSDDDREALRRMADDVVSLYSDAVQQVAAKNLNPSRGMIEIRAYENDKENPWKERVLEELPTVIEKWQDAGVKARDIAVLVRKAEDGRKVIERLISYKKSPQAGAGYCYDAITGESLWLGNAPVVRLLVNLVRYLQNNDKIALAEVCFNYSLIIHGEEAVTQNPAKYLSENVLPEEFLAQAGALIRLPVYEMNEHVIRMLELGKGEHREYIQVYQDAVQEFFSKENRDIREFLEWWDETGRKISVQIPDSVNAIRVMTIHKAKGLEFRAVIVPFADWKLDHDSRTGQFMWCRTERDPYDEMGYLPVSYSSILAETHFAGDYFAEMIKAHIDNLNLLYVALTRAEEYLLVNCPPESKNLTTVGDVLIRTLNEATFADPVKEVDGASVKTWLIGSPGEQGVADDHENNNISISGYRSSDWRQRLAIRRRGAIFKKESRDRIDYGLLVHEILANVTTEEDVQPLIDLYHREGRLSEENRRILMDQLNHILANPEVKKWFDGTWEVKREAPVIMAGASPLRPDRVMIKGNKAVVIDFKTGGEKSADRRQVLQYRDTLVKMGYEDTEAWLLYIGLNKVIKIA